MRRSSGSTVDVTHLVSVQASRYFPDALLVSAGMNDLADHCLHELFEEQARRTPDALALEDARISLTYSELDTLADRLAAYLGSRGIGPDEPVGVYMERRAEYVVACLAAMKAGGAYLILELAYPPPLLADVVADASPRIVLTQERYTERAGRDRDVRPG